MAMLPAFSSAVEARIWLEESNMAMSSKLSDEEAKQLYNYMMANRSAPAFADLWPPALFIRLIGHDPMEGLRDASDNT